MGGIAALWALRVVEDRASLRTCTGLSERVGAYLVIMRNEECEMMEIESYMRAIVKQIHDAP